MPQILSTSGCLFTYPGFGDFLPFIFGVLGPSGLFTNGTIREPDFARRIFVFPWAAVEDVILDLQHRYEKADANQVLSTSYDTFATEIVVWGCSGSGHVAEQFLGHSKQTSRHSGQGSPALGSRAGFGVKKRSAVHCSG